MLAVLAAVLVAPFVGAVANIVVAVTHRAIEDLILETTVWIVRTLGAVGLALVVACLLGLTGAATHLKPLLRVALEVSQFPLESEIAQKIETF